MFSSLIKLVFRGLISQRRTTTTLKSAFGAGILITFIYFHYKRKKKNDRKSITSAEEEEEGKEKELSVEFPNVAFYKNEIPSMPEGDCIENILTLWKGDYYKLETDHCYIQWLFPNKTHGINAQSYLLKDLEAEIISRTPQLKERVKRSFEMMLDFYGMKLTKDNKFELADNAPERLNELNQWGNHNFLRISRILLSLKLLGHSNLMLPWLKFLVDLIYVKKVLDLAASSFEDYWLATLDAEDKIELNKYKMDRE